APDALYEAALAMSDASAAHQQYAAAIHARDAGQTALAVMLLARVVEAGGVLAPMADLRLAQALVAAGLPAEASEAFARVIDDAALPPSLHRVALAEAAANLARLDRPTEAMAVLALLEAAPGATA